MQVRELKETDRDALRAFFLSCSDETVFEMNRFNGRLGPVNKEPAASAMADMQTSPIVINEGEEVGFVATLETYAVPTRMRGEVITGYGFLRFSPHRPTQRFTCSLGVMVADAWQMKGIGSALMNRMLQEARIRKMKKIWLQTYSDNFIAIKLYRKWGFEIEAVFKKQEWRDEEPMDVVSMARFLP